MSNTRLTLAALVVFALILIPASLGWCGKPSDHKPKPNPSISTEKKNPVPSVRKS